MAKSTYEEWLKHESEFVDLIYKSSKEDIVEIFWKADQNNVEFAEMTKEILDAYNRVSKNYKDLEKKILAIDYLNKSDFRGIGRLYNNRKTEMERINLILDDINIKFSSAKLRFHKVAKSGNKNKADNAAKKTDNIKQSIKDFVIELRKDGIDEFPSLNMIKDKLSQYYVKNDKSYKDKNRYTAGSFKRKLEELIPIVRKELVAEKSKIKNPNE